MGEIVVDVELDPHDGALWVMTTGASITRLWKSTDLGETFELASTVAEHYSANNLLVDPETPGVLLIGGHDNEDQANIRGEVLTSLDGGATWEHGSTVPVTNRNWTLRVVGRSPLDPARLFAWEDTFEGSGQAAQPDALWMSTDGAESWVKIYQGAGDLPGFAFSPDGARIAFAGP
jgi:hypothetical protein